MASKKNKSTSNGTYGEDEIPHELYDYVLDEADNFHEIYENQGFTDYGESSGWGQSSGAGHGGSWPGSYNSQILEDEFLARQLQEMEDSLGAMSMYGPHETITDNRVAHHRGTSLSVGRHQDGPDIDNMTYEQITQLGQSIGTVSKGLSEEQVSRLPSHKYKSSWRRGKSTSSDTECVICKMEYVRGAKLIALPCAHQYHEDCIKTWLKDNKVCCVCKKDVF